MAFLVTSGTKALIQGMTGKEGQRALGWMRAAGTEVLAGVTPGKGGQEVGGVPVFDSVAEATVAFPQINATTLYVPPRFVLSAFREAAQADIPLIHIFAENVPVKDTAEMIELSGQKNIRVVGPSSVGVFSPGVGRLGTAGGGDESNFLAPSGVGGVAIISKSGGMIPTLAFPLTQAGIAQTTVVGIGGDSLVGSTYADLLDLIAADGQTKALFIIGEIGGSYEEQLAEAIIQTHFAKPVVALITGLFAQTLPQGSTFGHAGAIVSRTEGTREGKIKALQRAGVTILDDASQVARVVGEVL
ncbi:MAG: CoA-binding protein [Pseudomonadales bacterium]|nr:CoA-binding protein [Candidatus Woesebacteria bacterium]MCB9801677.1 CoA-binding protein [Pseudomonadales bacterium]